MGSKPTQRGHERRKSGLSGHRGWPAGPRGTFKVFGIDDPRGYLDKYSIRESISDGTTVPLHYALARNDLQVDREVLDREFLSLADLEGVSDIENLNRVLDRAVTLKNMLKSPERVQRVAEFVARHFQETIAPMGYEAFLVAVDREAWGRRQYLGVTEGLAGDKAVERILEHFRDAEQRDAFYRFFRELQELYEILSPDPFLRPFVDDYLALGNIYQILRSAWEARAPIYSEFLRKTADLVQKHTKAGDVGEPGEIYTIGIETLDEIAAQDTPDVVKVSNLLKVLRHLAADQAGQQPHLIPIGERAEAIVRAFEEGQISTQETLRQLLEGPVREA